VKKIDLAQAITILANVGVIAGLIFVGLQLRQEHLIARTQMIFTSGDQSLYWAEIATDNLELWFKGLSDEPLTPEEAEGFNTLAEAWMIRFITAYAGTSQLGVLGSEHVYVQEAALKLHQSPGLLRLWRSFQERARVADRAFGYVDLVNQELERLSREEELGNSFKRRELAELRRSSLGRERRLCPRNETFAKVPKSSPSVNS